MISFKKISVLIIVVFFAGCVNDKEEGVLVSDATLFNIAQTSSSFSFYKNSSDTLKTDPQSPHQAYIRIRFNPKAASAMNDSLSRIAAPSFPDESMIVKEVYSSRGGPLTGMEIMYKLHNASNSGSGWVWSELNPDGTPVFSATKKGGQCVDCHSSEQNSDLVRTFFLH